MPQKAPEYKMSIANALNNQEMYCYLRRQDGRGWVRGRAHHHQALLTFLEALQHRSAEQQDEPLLVRVAHVDGGDFVATFRRGGQQIKLYEDEYGNRVEIMMMAPEYAGFINRIIDHY